MANHEQDQTPDAAAEGMFRWPATGLPHFLGQPATEGEQAQDGYPGDGPGADGPGADGPGADGPGADGLSGEARAGDGCAGASQAGAGWTRPAPLPLPGEPPPWQPDVAADSLAADLLLPGRPGLPLPGWRLLLHQASAVLVRPRTSAAEVRWRELTARARAPLAGGHHRVAVLSLKGGVGKTTTVMGLGSTLASLRGDRVIAVDASPDRGTLPDRLRLETAATVRDLLSERDQIQRYADVRALTSQASSGLEVLAGDRDPAISVAFSDQDYQDVAAVLERYYPICITDCGTGLLYSAMAGVLRLADQVVLVSSPSIDGARSASATLDWLRAHGYGGLARAAVVAVCVVRPRRRSAVDLAQLEQHFGRRCRAVVRIPYDPCLEEGGEVELEWLARPVTDAYLALAAEVADGFG